MDKKYKYNSIAEFKKDYPKEYLFLKRIKLVQKLCEDMGWKITRPNGYWTKERCMEEAKKYKTRSGWAIGVNGGATSYNVAKQNGWLDECTSHMNEIRKQRGYWQIKENCIEEARKYNTIKEWCDESGGSYMSAKKNGWVDECVANFVGSKKLFNYYTKEICLEEALKYKTIMEWVKNSSNTYNAARRIGVLKECTAHMSELTKPTGYWTKERCIEEARKYKTSIEWYKSNSYSYKLAGVNEWLKECTAHMKKR